MAEGSVEDMRKAVDLIVKTTGAEAEKKQDANAGLPVFNIVFHAPTGTLQMTNEAPAPALVHEEPLTLELEPVTQPEPVEAPTEGKAAEALPTLVVQAVPFDLSELDRELGLC